MQYLLIGIGGAIGASVRYTISLLFVSNHAAFPLATFTVNLFGCFVLGFLTSPIDSRIKWKSSYKTALKTGLIGSFTTFSTFSIELLEFISEELYTLGVVYLLTSAILGTGLVILGFQLGKKVQTKERLS